MCFISSLDNTTFIEFFLATAGDLKAVLVQAIVLVLGVLIYIPFVKINDRVLEKQAAMENEGEE